MTDIARLHALLAEPDPPDLIGRGHHQTYAGDPRRRQTVLLPLLIRWAQYRHLEHDPAPYLGKPKPAFRLLRRVG